jgi:hypothetical protein
MKKVRLLLCILSLAGLGLLTACDDDDGGGGSGGGTGPGDPGPGDTNNIVAPASLAGKQMAVTTTDGQGTYTIWFSDDTNFEVTDAEGSTTSQGTYEYTPGSDNTAVLVMHDSVLGEVTSSLTFDTATSGTIHSQHQDGSSEDGSFTLN